MDPGSLYASPNALAPHYSRFRVSERLLLTGHSHQAWPDCGFEGQQAAWQDAARFVDDKWDHAFAQAERVRQGFAGLLGDAGGGIALGANTHELVVRLISALPLRSRPRLVTTDGEFHSIRRQLDRLEEEGLAIVRVPEAPLESLAARLSSAVDDRTAMVLVSAVFFDTGRIARGLADVAASCRRHGSALLVDAYHALNVAHDARRALALAERYRQERVNGPLEQEALAVAMAAATTSHDPSAARYASNYLARFPNGRFVALARRVLGRVSR